MVRTLSILGAVCFLGALLAFELIEGGFGVAAGVVLLLLAFAIGGVLAVRRMFLKVREVVGQASAFAKSDIQHVPAVDGIAVAGMTASAGPSAGPETIGAARRPTGRTGGPQAIAGCLLSPLR